MKSRVAIDPKANYAKSDSRVCALIPSLVTPAVCDSRFNAGYRLLRRCARHMSDIRYAPRRINCMNAVEINCKNKDFLHSDLSSNVLASMKEKRFLCR